MADTQEQALTPLQLAEATLASIQQQSQQLQRQHRDLLVLVRQIEAEIPPLNLRKNERADSVRAIEANPGAYPPGLMREAYEGLADASMRIYLMQTQLEGLRQREQWLTAQMEALERYGSALEHLAASLRVESTRAAADSRAGDEVRPGTPRAELARQVARAQEQTRQDLAQKLQDGPVQLLSSLVLQAEVSQRLLGRDPARAREEMQSLKINVARALGDARFFITELRPPALEELGLRATLRRVVADLAARGGKQVRLEFNGQEVRYSAELETMVFRAVQEALYWALASTTSDGSVDLSLATQTDQVVLAVSARTANRTPGPTDYRDRLDLYAEALHARLDVYGPNEEGLRLTLVVPTLPQ